MAENQDIKQIIIDLFEISRKLTEFKNDNNKLLDEINKMDRNDLLLFDFYRSYSKVRGLRYYIVNKISQGVNITFEDIERKKEEINSEFPNRNVFRNWSNFSILFELYYKKYRDSVYEKLRKLHTFLRDQLKLDFNKTESIKGFDWNQQYGTTGCWVALIPEYLKDHKESVQLLIAINFNESPNKIEYGLYYGDNLGLKERNILKHFEGIAQLSINEIVSHLKSIIPAYIEANEEIYDLEIDKKKKKLEIITRDIDLSILESVFDEIPLYFDDRERIKNEILACLRSNKNIIFFGPPGTGKTQLAEIICKKIVEHNLINNNIHGYIFTTATSDWTTFETIGGYMPKMEEQNLEFVPGLFLQCFRNNQGDPINRWLIIDEINRADIDKAFGQLFSVLSGNWTGRYAHFNNFFEYKDGLRKFKEFVIDLIQVDKSNFYDSFKRNIIDKNHFINSSPIVTTLIQMVAVYFPNHFLPIYNIQMLEEKANNFGIDLDSLVLEEKLKINSKKSGARLLLLNELLIKKKTAHKIAKNWDNIVFTHFLFMCLPLKVLKALKKLNIGLKYFDPSDEEFVVGIFLKIHEKLGYKHITKLKKSYPDAEVETFQGEIKQVEFEYNSCSFLGHNPDICDVVVCWHDGLDGKLEKDNNIKVIAFDNILNENSELYKQLFNE